MDALFENKLYTVIAIIILLILKITYSAVIYSKINCSSKKTRNLLTYLSIPFPIITGIICVTKYKKSLRDLIAILITLMISTATIMTISVIYTYSQGEEFYDKNGEEHIHPYNVSFIDSDSNKYTFDYDKSGYDKLYINNTDKYLNADLCYIDSNGYLVYDEDMSITAKDETCCVDKDGSVYYPAKYTFFNNDGSINYTFNSGNFSYDRLGNAYTYDYVPYYDENGNRYAYTFNSSEQRGYYIDIETQEIFDNEDSFVDQNGYYVYDKEHEVVKQVIFGKRPVYKDSSNKIYYRAGNVSWDKDGNMLDSNGKIIE